MIGDAFSHPPATTLPEEDLDDLQAVFLAYPIFAVLCASCAAATRAQVIELAQTLCARPDLCPDGISAQDTALIVRFLGAPLQLPTPVTHPRSGIPVPSFQTGVQDDPA